MIRARDVLEIIDWILSALNKFIDYTDLILSIAQSIEYT